MPTDSIKTNGEQAENFGAVRSSALADLAARWREKYSDARARELGALTREQQAWFAALSQTYGECVQQLEHELGISAWSVGK